jgi:hypothetical protein
MERNGRIRESEDAGEERRGVQIKEKENSRKV